MPFLPPACGGWEADVEKLPQLYDPQAAETTGAGGEERKTAFCAVSHPKPNHPFSETWGHFPACAPDSGCLTRSAPFSLLTV